MPTVWNVSDLFFEINKKEKENLISLIFVIHLYDAVLRNTWGHSCHVLLLSVKLHYWFTLLCLLIIDLAQGTL